MNKYLRISVLFFLLISNYDDCFSQMSSLLNEGVRYPFSYRGSYWTLSRFTGIGNWPKTVHLHDISRTGKMELIKFELLENNQIIKPKYLQFPYEYRLEGKNSSLSFTFENADVLRSVGMNAKVRLSYAEAAELLPINSHQYRIMINSNRMVLTILKGSVQIEKEDLGIAKAFRNPIVHAESFQLTIAPDKHGVVEFAIERYVSEYVPNTYTTKYKTIKDRVTNEFEDWLLPFKQCKNFNSSVYDAVYLSWASLVKPSGNHVREGMMISKTWMNGIWSWDHCFNALAMMPYHPEIAWNQLMCVFDHQNDIGAIPDAIYVNDLQWGHLKQPIHGWTLMKMMEINPSFFDHIKLKEIYSKLELWTLFWLKYRDDDNNGIVQINHGNDNFDYLPIYDVGFPIEDPHVNMMLAFQMEALSILASQLERSNEAEKWKKQSEVLIDKIIKRCWNGTKFLYKKSGTEIHEGKSESVLHYTLMMLGKRLPDEIRFKLKESFLNAELISPYGVLTEGKKSPLFDENTYTRGCIWPPLNLFIIEGLKASSSPDMAKELALKYINNLENVGFSERFAAFTGNPLSDPSYTWTSSIYLYLKARY